MDQYSTPLSDLIPGASPSNGNDVQCQQQFPSNTPQEQGVCRDVGVSGRYDLSQPNFNQGDIGNIYSQQQAQQAQQAQQQQPQQQQAQSQQQESNEMFDMPKLITNLQSIPLREYALLIFVIWLIQNDDVISTMVKYLPVSITSGANLTKIMLSVVFAVAFYILREYLVFI